MYLLSRRTTKGTFLNIAWLDCPLTHCLNPFATTLWKQIQNRDITDHGPLPSPMVHFEYCGKSTKVLISIPSTLEPGRLDWSAQLLKLLPRHATDFSNQLFTYNSIIQEWREGTFLFFVGVFISKILDSPFIFDQFIIYLSIYLSIYLTLLICGMLHPTGVCIYLTVLGFFCSPYSSACVWLSVCRSASPGVSEVLDN